MGFRYQKRINLGGGLRLNLSKSTIGISAGVRGARVSINSKGRSTTSVGIPGTGLYYRTDRTVGRSARNGAGGSPSSSQGGGYLPPRIPLLAPKDDKQFLRGVGAYATQQYEMALGIFQTLAASSPATFPSLDYFTACCLSDLGRYQESLPRLERLLGGLNAGQGVLPDQKMRLYQVSVPIYLAVQRDLPIYPASVSNLTAWLSLAEAYVHTDQLAKAIKALEDVVVLGNEPQGIDDVEAMVGGDSFMFCLGWLTRLLLESDRYDEVISATDGIPNDDDVRLRIILWRCWAFVLRAWQASVAGGPGNAGDFDAALKLAQDADRYKARDDDLLLEATYLRGLSYEGLGKHTMAIREYQRVISADSTAFGGEPAKRLMNLQNPQTAPTGSAAGSSRAQGASQQRQGQTYVACPAPGCGRQKPANRRCPHCGYR